MPPPLPGGYKAGEKVFFTGAGQTVSTGDKLVHGQQGEVVGPGTLGTLKGKGVAIRFPGNKGNVQCFLYQVRRLRAASTATAGLCAPREAACSRPARAVLPQPDPSCKPLRRR